MGVATKQTGNVIIYRISDGAKGVWWPAREVMPAGYSLIHPNFPVMKPQGLANIGGFNLGGLTNPRNLLLIAGAVGIFFYRKPLLKILKKTGRKVGVK